MQARTETQPLKSSKQDKQSTRKKPLQTPVKEDVNGFQKVAQKKKAPKNKDKYNKNKTKNANTNNNTTEKPQEKP